jgi:hypothetical protein
MSRDTLISVVFLIFIAAISFQSILGADNFSCEVCIEYNDQRVCQKAVGADKNRTINQAIITACVGAGVDGFTEDDCQSRKPVKLECSTNQ